jgi:hypothetical protein
MMAASPQRGTPDQPAAAPGRSTLHLQLTPMLLIGLVVGVLSAVALVVTSVIVANQPPPPPVGGQGQPPPHHSDVSVIMSSAVFVVAWVTVAIAVARDHVVRRLEATAASRTEMLTEMNNWIAEQLATLREAGDQRETDAYLNGMVAGKQTPPPDGSGGRPLRTVPTPRDE